MTSIRQLAPRRGKTFRKESDLGQYLRSLEAGEKKWEGLCKRCGACCGAYDDPCEYLRKGKEGKYYCDIYPRRFGRRRSVKGEEFRCVSIKEILNTYWKNDRFCVYKQVLKHPGREK